MVYNYLKYYTIFQGRGLNMRGVESAKVKTLLYKCALYGVALYILAILQVTFFAKINIFNLYLMFWDKKYIIKANHWMVLFGRYVCKAQKPQCSNCPIFEYCNSKDKII